MTRVFSIAVLLLGAFTILWMGLSFVDTNNAALIVTIIIGVVYCVGFFELLSYQQATATLTAALSTTTDTPSALAPWLDSIHPSLQASVHQRIQGEHSGLPAPVLAPYLIGLLVMLGLLGTFIGMIDTLRGAVSALQGTSELEAIRAGLAAPIQGLGTAFGTSVAGVAASAMLGFVSTLSRRDRMLASRLLDNKIATVLQGFSLNFQRQQTFTAMQQQAELLPRVADKLTALIDRIDQSGQQLGERLSANQDSFHQQTTAVYRQLADSVEQSLQQGLSDSARLAGESIKPAIDQLVQHISTETQATHQQLTSTAQQQLETLSQQFGDTSAEVSKAWQSGISTHQSASNQMMITIKQALGDLQQQINSGSEQLLASLNQAGADWSNQQQASDQQRLEHWRAAFDQLGQQLQKQADNLTASNQSASQHMLDSISALLASSEQLVEARVNTESQWLDSYNSRLEQMTNTLQTELNQLGHSEAARGEAAIAQLAELESVASEQLAQLGERLEQPMIRLIETATETPRAAAQLFEQMRAEISAQLVRDNSLLEERSQLMAQLASLSDSLQTATSGQREAVDNMVQHSADRLNTIATRFAEQLADDVGKLSHVADHFAGSATEISSLGDAFGVAVQLFTDANSQLVEQLTRIEQSLHASSERSDEQLAYYITQAREIIDHSTLSQQELIDQLRQLSLAEQPRVAEAS